MTKLPSTTNRCYNPSTVSPAFRKNAKSSQQNKVQCSIALKIYFKITTDENTVFLSRHFEWHCQQKGKADLFLKYFSRDVFLNEL